METDIPIVMVCGTPECPRFFVAAAETDGFPKRFWNAWDECWESDRNAATLFADLYQVNTESQRIQRGQFQGMASRKFVVPVIVELFSNGDVTDEALQEWLRKTVQFSIAYGSMGNGPTDTSLALCTIHWDRFHEEDVHDLRD